MQATIMEEEMKSLTEKSILKQRQSWPVQKEAKQILS